MYKVLVFDLDDTLYPEEEFVLSGFKAVDIWLREQKEIKGFYDIAKRNYQDDNNGKIFNKTLAQLNYPASDDFIHTLVTVYRDHLPKISLFKDARAIIEHYKSKYKLAIITDGYYKAQVNKVKALNIVNDFDYICYSDKFGRDAWKPSKIPFGKVKNYFEVTDKECIYVADNVDKDFITPNRLGWLTIRVQTVGLYKLNKPKEMTYEAKKVLPCLNGLYQII